MSESESKQAAPAVPEAATLADFLERVPPGVPTRIPGSVVWKDSSLFAIELPRLRLHCGSAQCGGVREFDSENRIESRVTSVYKFAHYTCRNCDRTYKVFALHVLATAGSPIATVMKFGERPPFGPPTPARVTTLVGSAREYYFKGTRAENQGLGIAAFAYYRRVVEDRKAEIFAEIRRVASKLGGSPELLAELDAAVKEQQFSAAVAMVKHGIPASLMINGHNPLTLLHSALSEGLHAQTDAECLELATSIRVVLTDFVERVGNALKDEAALTAAVSRLMNKRAPSA